MRSNGLTAAAYAPVADLDPAVLGQRILDGLLDHVVDPRHGLGAGRALGSLGRQALARGAPPARRLVPGRDEQCAHPTLSERGQHVVEPGQARVAGRVCDAQPVHELGLAVALDLQLHLGDGLADLGLGRGRGQGEPGRDPANPKFSDHCFTGAYPTHLTDQTQVEPQPRQLSLLAEAS